MAPDNGIYRPKCQSGKGGQDRPKWRNWGETGNRRKRANQQNLNNLALFLNPFPGFADGMLGEIDEYRKDPPQGMKPNRFSDPKVWPSRNDRFEDPGWERIP